MFFKATDTLISQYYLHSYGTYLLTRLHIASHQIYRYLVAYAYICSDMHIQIIIMSCMSVLNKTKYLSITITIRLESLSIITNRCYTIPYTVRLLRGELSHFGWKLTIHGKKKFTVQI